MAASTRFAASIRSLKRVSSVLEPSCCRLFSALTPAEAGRKAEAMAAAMDDDKAKPVTLATLTARAGIPKIPNAPMAPPLHSATTYTRPASGIYEESDTIYARSDNPTRLGLEKAMFELECVGLDFNLEDKNHLVEPTTFAFSSGMMAVTSIVLAHTSPVTVIVPKDIYHGVPTLLFNVFSRHNVTIRAVDMTQVSQVVDAISNASEDSEVIVWMETPSNPLCQIVDIQAICNATSSISSHKVTTVVDATMTSPVLTRPLEVSKAKQNET
jgi:cystathionine beta-lyase/cystathionine gamma-synthase